MASCRSKVRVAVRALVKTREQNSASHSSAHFVGKSIAAGIALHDSRKAAGESEICRGIGGRGGRPIPPAAGLASAAYSTGTARRPISSAISPRFRLSLSSISAASF